MKEVREIGTVVYVRDAVGGKRRMNSQYTMQGIGKET